MRNAECSERGRPTWRLKVLEPDGEGKRDLNGCGKDESWTVWAVSGPYIICNSAFRIPHSSFIRHSTFNIHH
jgi:hypothetical protein